MKLSPEYTYAVIYVAHPKEIWQKIRASKSFVGKINKLKFSIWRREKYRRGSSFRPEVRGEFSKEEKGTKLTIQMRYSNTYWFGIGVLGHQSQVKVLKYLSRELG